MHKKNGCKYLFCSELIPPSFRIPLSNLLTIWKRVFGQIWEIIFFSLSHLCQRLTSIPEGHPLSSIIVGIQLNQLSEGRWESNILLWNISVVALCRHRDLWNISVVALCRHRDLWNISVLALCRHRDLWNISVVALCRHRDLWNISVVALCRHRDLISCLR